MDKKRKVKNRTVLQGNSQGNIHTSRVDASEVKEKRRIRIIPILLILVIVAVIVTVCILINKPNYDYDIEVVTDIKYAKLLQNGKSGVLDGNGNILIEPSYDFIDIPNPSKPVFICNSEYNTTKKEYNNTKVLNDKGEEILKSFEKISALRFTGTVSDIPYEKSTLKYLENGKWGIIDFEGNKLCKAEYDSIESLSYKEGSLLVVKDGKTGVMNIKGKIIIEPEYSGINADNYYNEKTGFKNAGFVIYNETDEGIRYGYVNSKGDQIIDVECNALYRLTDIRDDENVYILNSKNGKYGVQKNKVTLLNNDYENIQYDSSGKLYKVQKMGKLGIMDFNGKQVLKPEYDDIRIMTDTIEATKEQVLYTFDFEGTRVKETDFNVLPTGNPDYYIATTKTYEGYGITNQNKEIIVDIQYDNVEYTFDKYFVASKNGKQGVINDKNEVLIDFEYDSIQRIGNIANCFQAIIRDTATSDIYNSDLRKVATEQNASIYYKNEYIQIISDKNIIYLNKTGNEIQNTEIFKDHTLFARKKNNKWGFVNSNYEFIVEAEYDMVTEFNNYGYAGIQKDGKWGVVGKDGKVILEPTYDGINWKNPEFIGKYGMKNISDGYEYYTDELMLAK